MKTSEDMTVIERLDFLKKSGVTMFPNLSDEDKKSVLYFKNEPDTSVQKNQEKVELKR